MISENALKEKSGKWLLKDAENGLKNIFVSLLPSWIETHHLTWLILIWSAIVIFCFYLGMETVGNLLPYLVSFVAIFLSYAFIASQVKLWRIDMNIKNNKI